MIASGSHPPLLFPVSPHADSIPHAPPILLLFYTLFQFSTYNCHPHPPFLTPLRATSTSSLATFKPPFFFFTLRLYLKLFLKIFFKLKKHVLQNSFLRICFESRLLFKNYFEIFWVFFKCVSSNNSKYRK